MKISERELFQHVMIGFMTEVDPMLAMLKMDYRAADADRGGD